MFGKEQGMSRIVAGDIFLGKINFCLCCEGSINIICIYLARNERVQNFQYALVTLLGYSNNQIKRVYELIG